MARFAAAVLPLAMQFPGSVISLAKPHPPCVALELLLKSVLLPRTALQFRRAWSDGLSLANMPSNGFVWRGPVPKYQVTPSDSPSGWHEPQLLHASLDCLPRKCKGTMLRISLSKIPLSGMPRAVKNATLPSMTECSRLPGAGGSLEAMSRAITVFVSRSIAVTEKLASLFA